MGNNWSGDENARLVSRLRTERETDRSKRCGRDVTVEAIELFRKKQREKGDDRGGKGVTVIRRALSTPPSPSTKVFKDLSDEP